MGAAQAAPFMLAVYVVVASTLTPAPERQRRSSPLGARELAEEPEHAAWLAELLGYSSR